MQMGILDTYLENCERHLDTANARNTEVESYLVQYLLARICAECEARIVALVQRRCSRMRDIHVRNFTERAAKDACRSFSIGEIKGILGRFGVDYKKVFNDRIVNTPAHVAWDNIYNNRQAVAHGAGAQMSFADLRVNFEQSLDVLDALVAALDLRLREIRDLR